MTGDPAGRRPRKVARLVTLTFALSCDAAQQQPSRDSATSPPDTVGAPSIDSTSPKWQVASQEIYIDSVTSANPLVVYGRARTFENTVQVRVRDAGDSVVSEVFETSIGEMGNHNPFVARVWLTREAGPYVTVEAFEYSAKDGSVRSLTSRRAPVPPARMRVQLLFTTDDCVRTAPFPREVPRAVAVARVLVEALVAGPTPDEKSAGATAPFPVGSRVNSVVLRGGVLTVDFNERLQNVGGSCAAQAIRASVTQTLQRLPGVQSVLITAAGSRALALQP